MRHAAVVVTVFCLAFGGCGGKEQQTAATPREPDAHSTGYYCGMALKEHKGPKGQILLKGMSEPLWFSSVRDALTYVEQDLASENELAGFWVNDMAQGTWDSPAPGSWIDARTAWFVVDSKKLAAMGGSEAIPFKDRSVAEAFAKEQGGRITDYASARRVIASTSPPVGGDGS